MTFDCTGGLNNLVAGGSKMAPCTGLCYFLQMEKLARELGISNTKDKVQ
jgi:hypothetical protein